MTKIFFPLIFIAIALGLTSCTNTDDSAQSSDTNSDDPATSVAKADSVSDSASDESADTSPPGDTQINDTDDTDDTDDTANDTFRIDTVTAADTAQDTSTIMDTATGDVTDTADTDTTTASDPSPADSGGDTVSDETKDSDVPSRSWCDAGGHTPHTSADILLVVDNSGSMAEEQEMLATALFTLMNALTDPVDNDKKPIDDIRIAVTTTDMGVSYNGQPYEDDPSFPKFGNLQINCSGMGDNGAFISEYERYTEVNIQEGVIACRESATQCPPNWTCENLDTEGIGVCMNPNGTGESVICPYSPAEMNKRFVDNERSDKGIAIACLAGNMGTGGCNFEQQLKAASAGMTNSGTEFVRADSLTAIVIVSDEDDCSIASSDWHNLSELGKVTANLTCGRHHEHLHTIDELKTDMASAKIAAGGSAEDLVFAAIAGVPMVDACQGTGDAIPDCLSTGLGVNGTGTMGAPDEIGRITSSGVEQFYFEYACQRIEGDVSITNAYPGKRYVQMAQSFGSQGYVYSICNSDWGPAMENIADVVQDNVKIICLE